MFGFDGPFSFSFLHPHLVSLPLPSLGGSLSDGVSLWKSPWICRLRCSLDAGNFDAGEDDEGRDDVRKSPSENTYVQDRVDSGISCRFCKRISGLQQSLDTAHNGSDSLQCMGDSTGRRASTSVGLPTNLQGRCSLLVHYIRIGSVHCFYEQGNIWVSCC